MTSTTEKYLFKICKKEFNTSILSTIKNAQNVNCMDNCGWTPLMYAISHDRTKTIDALLEAGADPNIKCGKTTPLMLALDTNKWASFQSLLNATVELPIPNGNTLLIYAISKCAPLDIVQTLVDSDSDINQMSTVEFKHKDGTASYSYNNALSCALYRYQYNTIEYLLSIGCTPVVKPDLRTFINMSDKRAKPILNLLLHYNYTFNGSENICMMQCNDRTNTKLAIIYGMDVDLRHSCYVEEKKKTRDLGNIINYLYETHGHANEHDENCGKARVLLTAGLQIFREIDMDKNSLWMIAERVSKYDHINRQSIWLEQYLYTTVLLAMGADPNFVPQDCRVPRFAKMCKRNKDLPVKYLQLFINAGVDLKIHYKYDITVLDKLLSRDYPEVHQYLLENGLVTRENIHGLSLTFLNHYSELVEKLQQQLLYQMKPGDLAASLLQEEFPNVKKFDLFK